MKKDKFITGYEIVGDEIIISLSFDQYVIPYTKENEIELIEKLESQVKEARDNKFTYKGILYGAPVATLLWSFGFANHIHAAAAGLSNLPAEANLIVGSLFGLLTITGAATAAISIKREIDIKNCQKLLNDKKVIKVDFLSKNRENELEVAKENNAIDVLVEEKNITCSQDNYPPIKIVKPKTRMKKL